MKYLLSILFTIVMASANAQKPFAEGIITYNVVMESADHKELKGVYTFTIKGSEIKKELKMDNGYQDVILLNCSTGDAYSLQAKYGRKYAIQLNMNDITKKQDKYVGYTISNERQSDRKVAGIPAYICNITYRDGSVSEIYYTKDWCPTQGITYERFPSPKFLPLSFSYKDENGVSLRFEAVKIESTPVENAVFRLPADYKIISNKEYKEMSR